MIEFPIAENEGSNTHLIRPEHINARRHLWDAFNHHETEISAGWIVRLCQEKKGWNAFSKDEIERFYNCAGLFNFSFNRLLSNDIALGEDGKYRVTHRFISRCFSSSPAEHPV